MTLFFFFLIIDLCFLIPPTIAQIFNPNAELKSPIGITIKEVKTETKIHPVIVGAKARKFSI